MMETRVVATIFILKSLSCLPQVFAYNTGQSGCPEELWGPECEHLCNAGCRSGCTQIEGRCIGGCRRGWTNNNTNCDIMCPHYRHGFDCQLSCGHCYDDEPCNIVTGECKHGCMAGFRGDRCDLGCESFFFGFNCNQSCGHCRQKQECNRITGKCPDGCDKGWLGLQCKQSCPEGYYGMFCSETCAHCIGNRTCDHRTGVCSAGCERGWRGPMCKSMCHPGRFGINCSGKCGRCLKGTCDPVTGDCYGGCSRGYHGSDCLAECPTGWHGENCSVPCGHCDTQVHGCHPVNGICNGGCQAGWHGVFCVHNCSSGTYGANCKFKCGNCKDDAACDIKTGMCRVECKEGFYGDMCDNQNVMKMASSFQATPIFPVLVISFVFAIFIMITFFIYFTFVRPRRLSIRHHYITSSADPTANTYEQTAGSPWEIQRGHLLLGNEFLGNGQFGQVRKGHVKSNGTKVPVAIKSLKENASDKDKRDFMNELSILKHVGKHPNVVCLVGACHIKGVMYVAMEYAKHGDLRTFLRKSRQMTAIHEYDNTSAPFLNIALGPQVLLKFALDAANGLKHLTEKEIIHRDVAARNVLLADQLVAKIADFGLSKNDLTYVKTSCTRVPIRWMAVESLFNNTYTPQSDVWSFGVLLWEIFTLGGTPYSSTDSQQLFTFLKDGHRLRKPRLCDQDMYSMMLQCWNEKPERRPKVDELEARLYRMIENSEVYMNLDVQEETLYAEIDHTRESC